MRSPFAVTTSAASRLSIVRPKRRLSQPKPPPRVSPAMPVVELMPSGVARPCACVARSTSASVAPASTRAMRTRRVDVHVPHGREVDHEAVVADGVAGDVVAAAANRDEQRMLAREPDRCGDISGVDAARRSARAAGRSSRSRWRARRRSQGKRAREAGRGARRAAPPGPRQAARRRARSMFGWCTPCQSPSCVRASGRTTIAPGGAKRTRSSEIGPSASCRSARPTRLRFAIGYYAAAGRIRPRRSLSS